MCQILLKDVCAVILLREKYTIKWQATCSDNKDNRQLERLVQVNRRDALSDIKSAFNKHRNKSV